MRCKHVCAMNSCFAMELFLKINAHFLSAFTMYVIRLTDAHVFFHPSFSRSRSPFSPSFFFFFLYGDLLGFIPGRSQQHLSKAQRVVSKGRMALCKTQSNRRHFDGSPTHKRKSGLHLIQCDVKLAVIFCY